MSECIRQIDKTNNNRIGYFHQYLFRYAGNGWEVPENGEKGGFDIVNEKLNIFVEMKNKHNTMNSASVSATYLKMLDKIMRNDQARCLLVEVIASKSQNEKWSAVVQQNGHRDKYSHDRIRRVSIDKFYEIVFGIPNAFRLLYDALPLILDDVIKHEASAKLSISVYDELDKTDFYKSLYMLAFSTYEGFNGGNNND